MRKPRLRSRSPTTCSSARPSTLKIAWLSGRAEQFDRAIERRLERGRVRAGRREVQLDLPGRDGEDRRLNGTGHARNAV